MNEPKPIRVMLVDDHAILRQGLVRLINQEADLEVCGEAEEGPKAFEMVYLWPEILKLIIAKLNNKLFVGPDQ